MNLNDYTSFFKNIANFQKTQSEYLSFGERMQKYKEAEIPSYQLDKIEKKSAERLNALKKLKRRLRKQRDDLHIPQDIWEQVMLSVNNAITSASMVHQDCLDYRDPGKLDKKTYLDSMILGLHDEKEYAQALTNSLIVVQKGTVNHLLNGDFTAKQVREIISTLSEDSPVRAMLNEHIDKIEKEKKNPEEVIQAERKAPEVVSQEPPNKENASPEKKSGGNGTQGAAPSGETPPENEALSEEKMSFADKYNKVDYQGKGTINKAIQNLTLEERLEQIEKSLAELEEQEQQLEESDVQFGTKTRMKIEKTALLLEKKELEAYREAIQVQKQSLGEKATDRRIEQTMGKIAETKKRLGKSQERRYSSELARFFSARYQEQLQVDIERLESKRGVLQDQQKRSAVVTFSKNAGKIATRSRRNARKKVLMGELIALGNDLRMMQQDVSERFVSQEPSILSAKPLTTEDLRKISSLEDRRQVAHQMA